MTRNLIIALALLLCGGAVMAQSSDKGAKTEKTVKHELTQKDFDDSPEDRYKRLTQSDYQKVADELGVETAAIKALCAIEAGGQGFVSPGKPVINFDLTMFKRILAKNGHTVSAAQKKAPIAFARVNTAKYGSYGAAQHARLDDACRVNKSLALQATFWGMFQIGGFNYRQCDCESVEEFVKLMSQSEAMQLELFARFIRANNLVGYIRNHNWYQFSKGYNGGRAVKGYASRMAAKYKTFKAQEAAAAKK